MKLLVKSQSEPALTPEEDFRDVQHQRGMLELMISCTDLVDLDVFSKTDPMCVLFVRRFGQWKELGRTEAVLEMLSPQVFYLYLYVNDCLYSGMALVLA